jgi:ribosomal protein S18|tara:strand:- start:861 stop:1202 length:342 start_codon:yes stop_codon:yes gene_type:complete
MALNYWNKEKKTSVGNGKKKRINWQQSLNTSQIDDNRPVKIKKSLQYILLLKKFDDVIDYKNVKLLTAFLTKYGKIRARRKTRISVQAQRRVAKAIRKARACGVIPFTCDVKL